MAFNVVVEIEFSSGSKYFSLTPPDRVAKGFIVSSNLLKSVSVPRKQTNLIHSQSTTTGTSFSVIDKDRVISREPDSRDLLRRPVKIHLGETGMDKEFPNDYRLIEQNVITKLSNDSSKYSFNTSTQKRILNFNLGVPPAKLEFPLSKDGNFLVLKTAPVGKVNVLKIGQEFLHLEKINGRVIRVIRGARGTEIKDHDEGSTVEFVTSFIGHPVDIFQTILIENGIAIDDIDLDSLERAKKRGILGTTFEIFITGQESALKFIENELLLPIAHRVIEKSGRISLTSFSRLDVNNIFLNNKNILNFKNRDFDYSNITNEITVEYDYDITSGEFKSLANFRDEASIERFGRTSIVNYRFKGIRTELQGESLLNIFKDNLFTKFAFPLEEYQFSANIEAAELFEGDGANVETLAVPTLDGQPFFETLLVKQRHFDISKGEVSLIMQGIRSQRAGLRNAYISPSPKIITRNGNTILISTSKFYQTGMLVNIWDDEGNRLGENVLISDVAGNMITLAGDLPNFTAGHISFADFPRANNVQKSFAYLNGNYTIV